MTLRKPAIKAAPKINNTGTVSNNNLQLEQYGPKQTSLSTDAARMSGRLLSSRLAPALRQASLNTARSPYHTANRAGGLLRSSSARWPQIRPWPLGSSAIHNVPAVRHASFARAIPKLALKLIRFPAMIGAIAISSLAYIQYQAARMFNHS